MSERLILIADDHKVIAESVAATLRPEFGKVEVVFTIKGLIKRLKSGEVALVVLDLSFREDNALDQLRQMKLLQPDTQYVIFTASEDRVLVDVAHRNGALGFVIKESSTEDLKLAIRAALEGERFVSSALRGKRRLPLGTKKKSRASAGRTEPTSKEMEVLGRLHKGLNQKQAAAEMGMTRKGIEYHVREAGKRLGFRGAPLLVRWYEERMNRRKRRNSD